VGIKGAHGVLPGVNPVIDRIDELPSPVHGYLKQESCLSG
jgi:hypothetical protein